MAPNSSSLLVLLWLAVAYYEAAAPPSSVELVYFNGGKSPKNLDNS